MLTGRVLVSGVVVLAAAAFAGCGSSDDSTTQATRPAAPTQTTTSAPAAPTTVAPPPVLHGAHLTSTVAPRLAVKNFYTRASVPQVTGLHNAAKANRILLATVTHDEKAYAPQADADQAAIVQQSVDMQGAAPITPDQVTYSVLPTTKLIVARPAVVSALLPVQRGSLFQPEDYLSATVDMHSGKRVTFADVFKHPSAARRAIAHAATDRLYATVKCMHNLHRSDAIGLQPKPGNYRQFALLPGGVTFGFSGSQTSCGRANVALPYSVVRTHLTPLGRRLLSAAGASTA